MSELMPVKRRNLILCVLPMPPSYLSKTRLSRPFVRWVEFDTLREWSEISRQRTLQWSLSCHRACLASVI